MFLRTIRDIFFIKIFVKIYFIDLGKFVKITRFIFN